MNKRYQHWVDYDQIFNGIMDTNETDEGKIIFELTKLAAEMLGYIKACEAESVAFAQIPAVSKVPGQLPKDLDLKVTNDSTDAEHF